MLHMRLYEYINVLIKRVETTEDKDTAEAINTIINEIQDILETPDNTEE